MEDRKVSYNRCPNCGKYFIPENDHPRMFCSEECAGFYKACVVCGKYFSASREDEAMYCSTECGANPLQQVPEQDTQSARL